MKHAHSYITCGVLLGMIMFTVQNSFGRQFPMMMVSQPSCKSQERKDHNDACKIDIQDILDDTQGNNDQVARLVFSVLRGATYTNGRDSGVGGHAGIDIVSAKGTPVTAIGPGEVIRAGNLLGFGTSVTIKHIYEGGYIFSNYSHLSKMDVQQGDIVKEGQKIGEVGKTGFSMGKWGNHLDFQITNERSPSHPYGYSGCGADYMDAVNKGSCRTQLLNYTIDPLKFFKEVKAIEKAPTAQPTPFTTEPDAQVQEYTISHEISRRTISGFTFMPTPLAHKYIIQSDVSVPDTFAIGKIAKISISLDDTLTKEPVTGVLKAPVSLQYNKDIISISPDTFSYINKGNKNLFIKAKQSGTTAIHVLLDGHIVDTHYITVQ